MCVIGNIGHRCHYFICFPSASRYRVTSSSFSLWWLTNVRRLVEHTLQFCANTVPAQSRTPSMSMIIAVAMPASISSGNCAGRSFIDSSTRSYVFAIWKSMSSVITRSAVIELSVREHRVRCSGQFQFCRNWFVPEPLEVVLSLGRPIVVLRLTRQVVGQEMCMPKVPSFDQTIWASEKPSSPSARSSTGTYRTGGTISGCVLIDMCSMTRR